MGNHQSIGEHMKLPPFLSRLLKPRQTTILIPGTELKVAFHITCDIEKFRSAEFGGEEKFLREFVTRLLPFDIVWDIGASIGLFGLSAAIMANRGEVYCFEPDRQIASRLRENLLLNDVRNVRVLECAVSDKECHAELFTNGINGVSPSLRRQIREGAPEMAETVHCETIDNLLKKGLIKPASVVKIDIEGAEGMALRGMEYFLEMNSPRHIFLEVHPKFLPDFECTEADCVSALTKLGYRPVWKEERADEIQYVFDRM